MLAAPVPSHAVAPLVPDALLFVLQNVALTSPNLLLKVTDADVGGRRWLSVFSVTQATHGKVVNNGNGTVTYTPAAGYLGTDSFTYFVTDNTNYVQATVRVVVSRDSDSDGLPDGWERFHFANLTTADATSDSNGDGTSDLAHYQAGETPNAGHGSLSLNPGVVPAANAFLALPNNLVHDHTTLTVEMWFKTTSGGVLLGYQETPAYTTFSHWVPILYVGTDGLLRGAFHDGNTTRLTSSRTVNDGEWHHVALVGADTTQALYLDGEIIHGPGGNLRAGTINHLDMAYNELGTGPTLSYPATIAEWWYPFQGQIDELRFWSTARTAAQLDALRLASLRGDEAGLIGYWPFDHHHGAANLVASGGVATAVNNLLWASDSPVAELDSDGDGMSDAFETVHGFDPLNAADAALDRDGDGITNLNEYLAGAVNEEPVAKLTVVRPVRAGESVSATLNGWDREGPLTYEILSLPTKGSVVLTDPATGAFTYTAAYTASAAGGGRDTFTYRVSDGVTTSAVATVYLTVQPAGSRVVASYLYTYLNIPYLLPTDTWRGVSTIAAGPYNAALGVRIDGTVVARHNYAYSAESGWSGVVAVDSDGSQVFGIKSDGSVASAFSSIGTSVAGWSGVVAIAAGNSHAIGLKSDGTVVATGCYLVDYGQCAVAGWSDIVGIAAGAYHTVGLKSDGTVLLGFGAGQTNYGGWTGIVSVAAGGEHTVGLRGDGTVVAVGCGGTNDAGQCNVGGWSGIVAVAAGNQSTVGLKADGSLVIAGRQYHPGTIGWTQLVAVDAYGELTVGLKANNTPTASGTTLYTEPDTAIRSPNLLTLAADADGDSLTLVSVGGSAGTVSDNGDGTVTFTPASGFIGVDGFKFAVADGSVTVEANVDVVVSTDWDGDGVVNAQDPFPHDPAEWLDTDGDHIGNNADTDDDNDGVSDAQEALLGTDPLRSDSDGDGSDDLHDPFPLAAAYKLDADHDGLADEWETLYFGTLAAAGAATDFAQDGVSDLTRFRAGQTPLGFRGGLAFDGIDDYLKLPDNLIEGRTAATVELSFKTTSSGVLLGYQAVAVGALSYNVPALYVGVDGKLRGQFWDSVFSPFTSSAVVNDGTWHHAALTTTGTAQSLYLDGVLVGSRSGSIYHGYAMVYNQIGTGGWGGWPGGAGGYGYFAGHIDEVRVWSVARSAAELNASRFAALTGNEVGLIGYWRLDDGSGATAVNEVTGGAAALLMGSGGLPLWSADPAIADTDNDGLSDAEERTLGTNLLLADSDQDGLDDLRETLLGTNPLLTDSDGDGRSDSQEVASGTNPVSSDSDGDGLSDGVEATLGTNPLLADSDGDGLNDAQEVTLGTNPLAADSDGDGISDAQEIALGTSPLVADSDGDGVIDALDLFPLNAAGVSDSDSDGIGDEWEQRYFHNLTGAGPLSDVDGDGTPDLARFLAGVTPLGFRGSVAFDGVEDYLLLPSDLIRSRTTLTVELWFNTTGGGVMMGYQNAAAGSAAPLHVPLLYVGSDGKLRGQFWDGAMAPITSAGAVNDGLWHHAALVATGSGQTLYLDGKAAGSRSGAINHLTMSYNQAGTGSATGWPGGSAAAYDYFRGRIDEVRVWSVARTAAEVAAARAIALRGDEVGLLGYWRLDDGSGAGVGNAVAGQAAGVLMGAAGLPVWVADAAIADLDLDGVTDSADAFPLDVAEWVDSDGDGIGNNADLDDDNDGVADALDAFPLNAAESVDTDGDGIGNNADPDDDNDGVADALDVFPLNAAESVDTDSDGIGNNADPDDDNDGVADALDAFPLDPTETVDTDGDGIGNNADLDDDGDGVADALDAFPLNAAESVDSDGDGIGNNADPDDDNDGVADALDAFPLNAAESVDTDGDGLGNNADPDDDNDGVADPLDAFPLNAAETVDTDKDGIGNNADPDDDGDGVADLLDAFPLDAAESVDTDKDGIGNNADPDDDNDGVLDALDAFPLNAAESVDTDGDGIGNNADPDDDNDGVADALDVFPLNGAESVDTDGDGLGNNADPDDDNDGVADVSDAFPLDATETLDTDGDGTGNNADLDDDGDGVLDALDAFPLDATETLDTDKDGLGNNADPDDDNDGVADAADAFPLDAAETLDTDGDGLGNNADLDDDGDGVLDALDAFPLDAAESVDTDKDGIGNNADPDDDNDGVADISDAFPLDASETLDTDSDGLGNNADPDDDNDGVLDALDAFPLDATETVDSDKDGLGDTADPDDDNDGVADALDAFPLDASETLDTDSDGIGNNADPDDDNDGVADAADAFPLDGTETVDSDKDGLGNNADPDDDNDGVADALDAFPLDASETLDTDSDGIGNKADPDDDNDGVADAADAFPLDPTETVDTDGDGLGNNADPDDDNDGVADASDAFPLDASETLDTDSDGLGNNADPDDDNDGVADASDALPLDPTETVDTDGDGLGNNADPDDDNDGVADASDAFPLDANETLDSDGDGLGNNADPDDDNDGVADALDAFPLDPAETLDTDGDGIGNNADLDDDGDGIADLQELLLGTDPLLADTDGDGLLDSVDAAPLNAAPAAAMLNLRPVVAGSPVSGKLRATDREGDTITFTVVTPPSKGSLTADPASGAFTYTPSPLAGGRDRFTFKASDATGDSALQTVHLSVVRPGDKVVVAAYSPDRPEAATGDWRGIQQVAAGAMFTAGLKSDGTVVVTGMNLGDLSGWSGVVAIAAGGYHLVGLKPDGTVVATGYNWAGQTDVSGWADIVAVAAGYDHTVGLKADGTVVAVGGNYAGQTNVGGWSGVIAVAAGSDQTLGLKADGTVVGNQPGVSGWRDIASIAVGYVDVGIDKSGQAFAAGRDAFVVNEIEQRWGPIVTVAAGDGMVLGLKRDGTLVSAGMDVRKISQVEWIPAATGGALPMGSVPQAWVNLVDLAVGSSHAVGLKGVGDDLVLYADPDTAVTSATLLPAGATAITSYTNGNGFVTLNGDTLTYLPSPGFVGTDLFSYTVSDGVAEATRTIGVLVSSDWDGDGLPNQWEAGNGLAARDGTGVNGAAGDLDGDGYTNWEEFQFGTDASNPASSPNFPPVARMTLVRPVIAGATVNASLLAKVRGSGPFVYSILTPPAYGVVQVTDAATGAFSYTAGVMASGADSFTFQVTGPGGSSGAERVHLTILPRGQKVVAVGKGDNGQLNVGGWTDVVAVAAGLFHTVGLKADGTVVATGGLGTLTGDLANAFGSAVAFGQTDVAGWSNIVAIAAGGLHTVGLRADGTVVAVGDNRYGQLDVGSWSGVVAVAAGQFHTVGLKADGTVVAVGNKDYGQLDTGGWSQVVAVAAGAGHTLGLTAKGTVLVAGGPQVDIPTLSGWDGVTSLAAGGGFTVGVGPGWVVAAGDNYFGQGNVAGWANVVAVATGGFHTVGLRSDHSAVATGANGSPFGLNLDFGQTNVGGWGSLLAVAAGGFHTVGLRSNSAPAFTGTPAITGTPTFAATLSVADTGTSDADGDTVTLRYQWQSRVPRGVWTNVPGATNASYVVAEKRGTQLRVVVTADDGQRVSTSRTVVITAAVTVGNGVPEAGADRGSVAPGGTVVVAVTANDRDPDGDPLRVTSVSYAGSGTATVSAPGSVRFTAAPGSSGSESFTYTLSDGHGGSAVGSVTVLIASSDSDGDGIPDAWELAHGLNPNDAGDALLDNDGDGLTNLVEYLTGSDLNVADTDGDGVVDGLDSRATDASYRGFEVGSMEAGRVWKVVSLPSRFDAPVVVAGVPSRRSAQPGVVQLRSVKDNGLESRFEVRFQEWGYLDGYHPLEAVPYLVVERGVHETTDGSVWQAQVGSVSGNRVWTRLDFAQPFTTVPRLLASVQSANNGVAVTARVRNVDTTGFEVALYPEEADTTTALVAESVGYVAVESASGSGALAGVPYLLQSLTLTQQPKAVGGVNLLLEEERSLDNETAHAAEQVEVLLLGRHQFAQAVSVNEEDTFGLRRLLPEDSSAVEWGAVEGLSGQWVKVPYTKGHTDPVVIGKVGAGSPLGTVRVRNLTATSAELRFEAWDGSTGVPVRLFYLMAERGLSTVGGLPVEAGFAPLSANTPLTLTQSFAAAPVLFASVSTEQNGAPVSLRLSQITTTGFSAELESRKGSGLAPAEETVQWIALGTGTGVTDETITPTRRKLKVGVVNAGSTAVNVKHTVPYRDGMVLFAELQSRNEAQTAVGQVVSNSTTGAKLRSGEEAPAAHLTEGIGLFEAQ